MLITDDRDGLLRRLQPTRDLTSALAVEQARLIASARAALPAAEASFLRVLGSGRVRDLLAAHEERHEARQRARADIDQVEHHGLLEQRRNLNERLPRAQPAERPAFEAARTRVNDRLYTLRHGARTELGRFEGRLSMSEEADLHAAHRLINTLADERGWPETRSPLTAAYLTGLDVEPLQKVAERATRLTSDHGSGLPVGVARPQRAAAIQEFAELVRQARRPRRRSGPQRNVVPGAIVVRVASHSFDSSLVLENPPSRKPRRGERS